MNHNEKLAVLMMVAVGAGVGTVGAVSEHVFSSPSTSHVTPATPTPTMHPSTRAVPTTAPGPKIKITFHKPVYCYVTDVATHKTVKLTPGAVAIVKGKRDVCLPTGLMGPAKN